MAMATRSRPFICAVLSCPGSTLGAALLPARHGQRVDTGGLIGHLDLALDGIAGLWPYLHLGQWLGVGKNASMGFGCYELLSLDPARSGLGERAGQP